MSTVQIIAPSPKGALLSTKVNVGVHIKADKQTPFIKPSFTLSDGQGGSVTYDAHMSVATFNVLDSSLKELQNQIEAQ